MKEWIQTYQGKQFYPDNPTEDMICIEDIAHGLSNICRYTGQCPEFYSVGQHSLIVTDVIFKRTGDLTLTLEALMHDASEAYLCDIPKPLKNLLPDYQKIEDNVSQVIFDKFNITYPLDPAIKVADVEVLAKEHENFIKNVYDLKFDQGAPIELESVKIVPIINSEHVEGIFQGVFLSLINKDESALREYLSFIWR